MDAAIARKNGTAAGSSLDENGARRQVAAAATAYMARGAGAALLRRPSISADGGDNRARDTKLFPGGRCGAPLRWRAAQLRAAGGAVGRSGGPVRQSASGAVRRVRTLAVWFRQQDIDGDRRLQAGRQGRGA